MLVQETCQKFFRVTERPFEEILNFSNLTESDLKNLGPGDTVVEIGSGLGQEFAKGCKSLRDDIQFLSIDPSLAIPSKKAKINVLYELRTGRRTFEYFDTYTNPDCSILQQVRINNARNTQGVIAALAPDIPFGPSLIKWIIDVYGPGIYLETEELFYNYIAEISRVLQAGGRASIYPIKNSLNIDTLIDHFPDLLINTYRRSEIEYNTLGYNRTIYKTGIEILKV